METEALIIRTLDDLVFRTRNRDYGAYAIRQAYSKRVLLGAGLSVALFSALLVFSGFEKALPVGIAGPIIGRKFDIKNITDRPIIESTQRREIKREEVKSTRTNTTVQVVTTPVDPVVQHPEPSTVTGLIEGTEGGEAIEGTGTGLQELPIEEELPKILVRAEVMPTYQGGIEAMMKFLKKKIKYPASAQSQHIEGTVFVSFVVNGDGTVSNVEVLRGIHPKCDEEAVRVVSLLPNWIGGKQNGNPVAVRMVLPIKFNLNN